MSQFISGLSYNQPKFCPSAKWNPNAITFTNESTVGDNPYGIFVDINNTIYVADKQNGRVSIWPPSSTTPTRILSGGINSPFSLFVAINGDIFIDNGDANGRVDKWVPNATVGTVVMRVNGSCRGLFVDVYENIYCSREDLHRVIKRSWNDGVNTSTTVAGNGSIGLQSNMLNHPRGIFVDLLLNLYVADCFNHRVLLFQSGQLNGTMIETGLISLAYPTAVVLDGDGYLFISDSANNRIVGSNHLGFQCIVGCEGVNGNKSDQLNSPWGFSFDSYGNLYVVDAFNNRIQKFVVTKFCGKPTRESNSL